jgi:hypothetical protein
MTDDARLVAYVFGYALLLIAALVGLNVLLTRLTREERDTERQRRRRPGAPEAGGRRRR